MATLSEITDKLSKQTEQNIQATKELNKSNVTLRTEVTQLTTSVEKYATREKRVQFLENVLDTNNSGLADTFKETLMGPLTQLADAIPGKAFLMPLFKLAAQRTPLRGFLERRRDSERNKLQTEQATQAIEASGMKFGSEDEKQAAIERVKMEMAKKQQEEEIKNKNKQISDMLGLEIDKFESIIGKTEEVQEQTEQVASSGGGGATDSGSPYVPGAATDSSAAAVEEARTSERAAERRHRELINAIAGGDSKGGGGTIKEGDGTLRGVGGVIKSIGQGFKYLGKNLANIAKGALAMALMGASLIPFAISAKQFNEVEWESLGKAGVALLGLAGVAFLLGKASGSMITGALAIGVLGGALWVAGKGFQQFAELDWKTIGMGFVAIGGLGVIAAALSFALPFIIPGSIAIAALGAALIPFAYAAGMAAPALTEIASAFDAFSNVPISTMFAIPAALAAVGAALVAMSAGNFVSGILDGIGKLFGNESPIDKIVRLAESAPNVIQLGAAMRGFGDDVDAMMAGLDRLDPSKVDKLEELGEKIEKFMDSMPGVIGQAKLAAFALSFASIAASAGVAPAVAQGVADATGEVIEVQDAPKAYVAKKSVATTDMDGGVSEGIDAIDGVSQETVVSKSTDESVPAGMVKIKYKGKTHVVKREDAEKVQAINTKLEQLGERSQELNQQYEDAGPYQRVQKRRIKDANRAVVRQSVKLEKEKSALLESITSGSETSEKITPTSTTGVAPQMESAQKENGELQMASAGGGGNTIVNAPTTNVNNTNGGGGGKIMPVPMGEPDQKTRSIVAHDF